jgi:hypothetical protein
MVAAGRWRATVPDVKGHAGFRLNALAKAITRNLLHLEIGAIVVATGRYFNVVYIHYQRN